MGLLFGGMGDCLPTRGDSRRHTARYPRRLRRGCDASHAKNVQQMIVEAILITAVLAFLFWLCMLDLRDH